MTVHYRADRPAVELEALIAQPLRVRPRKGFYRDHLKRALDIVLASLLLLPALLVLAIVMPIVALDGASPIYRQVRVGRGGRLFRLWKLRSMVADADKHLARHLAENAAARAEWTRHQKLQDDPRITRFGRFIRRTSIDELPQLLNVLAGDMSLVGPRPMMVDQVDIYPGHAYYELKPGVTGFWQIADRHETSFAERALYDTRYYNQVSLVTDLKVLVATVGVVLRAQGA